MRVHIYVRVPGCPLHCCRGCPAASFRTAALYDAGRVFSLEDLEFIAQLCIEHNVYVLADEGAAQPCPVHLLRAPVMTSTVQLSVQHLKHHQRDGRTAELAVLRIVCRRQ